MEDVPYTMSKSKIMAVPVVRYGVAYINADTVDEAIKGVENYNSEYIIWSGIRVNEKKGIAIYEEKQDDKG